MTRPSRILLILAAAVGFVCGGHSAETQSIRVDFSRADGKVRLLHGVNKGPLAAGSTIDLTDRQKELGIPHTRLHDCQWPYPDVVDIHAIFRNPEADPALPASYDFALTDDYLQAIRKTGAEIIYRLGESIEHGAVKRFVHPPRDCEQWASVCLGIIRHYNEGWANGHKYGIRYWEIWNEPENRPAMWSGSDEDFLRLYRTAALAIKKDHPHLKVGGPAFGYSGRLEGGAFVPSELLTNLLTMCRGGKVPLDFLSWHCYTADPSELAARARAMRQLLDAYGLRTTESHLNEWNYLPGNSWDAFSKGATAEARQSFYQEMAGASGAAFVTAALIQLQDAPIDVCNLFHGEIGGFGLFNEYGVPNPVFYAMRAFNDLARLGSRAAIDGHLPGGLSLLASASPDRNRAAVLISSYNSSQTELVLEVRGHKPGSLYRMKTGDTHQPWHEIGHGWLPNSPETLKLRVSSPGIILLEIASNPAR